MSRPGPRAPAELAASVALTLFIFALPVWSASRPMPAPIVTHPSAPVNERIVYLAPPGASGVDPVEPTPTDEAPASAPVEAQSLQPVLAETRVAEAPSSEPAHPPNAAAPGPTLPPELSAPKVATVDAPAPRTKRVRTRRKRARDCKPDVPQIRSTGASRWDVERDLIDRYARDLKAASRLASVSWAHDARGRVIGFQVHRVRCGSPLHEAGFKNGDLVTQINGRKVRTVPQALAAYVALRIKRKLRVRGTRRDGQSLDLRYRLT